MGARLLHLGGKYTKEWLCPNTTKGWRLFCTSKDIRVGFSQTSHSQNHASFGRCSVPPFSMATTLLCTRCAMFGRKSTARKLL
jgi:hypothetical protein